VSEDDLHVTLAARLREAHRTVRTLDAPEEQKARVVRRLIALTDASKRDAARASARLDLLLADLDAGRLPVAGEGDQAL
jgi:outer membrane murein-binding lipoprotein Lpp